VTVAEDHCVIVVIAVDGDAQIFELEPIALRRVAVSLVDLADHA
jgi:hypothetical protein